MSPLHHLRSDDGSTRQVRGGPEVLGRRDGLGRRWRLDAPEAVDAEVDDEPAPDSWGGIGLGLRTELCSVCLTVGWRAVAAGTSVVLLFRLVALAFSRSHP